MKSLKLKRQILVLFFILITLTKVDEIVGNDNLRLDNFIEPLLQTKCDENKIQYTIRANLKEYMENENNIDGREIYQSLSDLKSKKIGACKGTFLGDNLIFDSVTEYENQDLIIQALKNHTIDGGIIFSGLADTIQEFSNVISKFDQPVKDVDIVFALQKGKDSLKEELNDFIAKNKADYKKMQSYWDLIWRETGFLNKTLTNTNGILKINAKINMSPHSYLRSYDNELIGAEIEFIYKFAREKSYELSFEYSKTDQEQLDALKNGKADIALGFFVKRDNEDIILTDILYSSTIDLLVRYSNLPASLNQKSFYGSLKEFNGEKLGIVSGTFYNDLSEKYFPDSEFVSEEDVFSLIEKLLLEEIDGFIYDQPVIEFYANLFQFRIAFFTLDELEPNKNAFAFQKNTEGEALAAEFNDFLKTIDVEALKEKWNTPDWTNNMEINKNANLTIDKNLNPNDKLLTVGFNLGSKPLSFYLNDEPMGLEVEIIYLFAKAKHYNIDFREISLEERTSLVKEGKVNITGGCFTITEERKQFMSFSDPLYSCGTVLATRVDMKKDIIPIEILDKNYNTKENKVVDVNVKFPNEINRVSSCVFPDYYNDTILINCTIKDIKDVNTSKGFTYEDTEDKILLLFNYFEANNFLKANTKITGHPNIIQESDKSEEIVCYMSPIKKLTVAGVGALVVALLYLFRLCL